MTRGFALACLTVVSAVMLTLPLNAAWAEDDQQSEGQAQPPAETNDGMPPAEGNNQVQYDPNGGEAPQESAASQEKAQVEPPQVDAREEGISSRLKLLVKRLNANDQRGLVYPSKAIETALRNEFMRRTDGGTGAPWPGRKRVRESDHNVALDNFELFITFAERLASVATKPSKKGGDKETAEMKLLAAKWVIDRYNSAKKGDRSPASVSMSPAEGLGATGKAEAQRRRKLVGNLVAGPDYSPIQVKKIDDFAKKYRAALSGAVSEYEALASLINKGNNSKGAGKGGKKRK